MEMNGTNFAISTKLIFFLNFLATDRGNAGVYSIMQEKRLGAIINEDGLEDIEMTPDYEFTCIKVLADGRACALGSEGGSLTIAYFA